MNGHEDVPPFRQIADSSSRGADGDHFFENAPGGAGAQSHGKARPNKVKFVPEPPPATLDLVRCWTLVQAPFAALLELEMLDRIGHERFAPLDSCRCQCFVENTPRRAHEWRALQVLVIAWLLAYQHQRRATWASSRHSLRRVAIKVAAAALLEFCRERHKRRGSGQVVCDKVLGHFADGNAPAKRLSPEAVCGEPETVPIVAVQ